MIKAIEIQRDHFTFFRSFREQIDLCSDDEQLRLYRAITDFALLHKDTEFDAPMLQMAWLGIKPHLEAGWTKYNNGSKAKDVPKPTLRGNRNAAKTTENEAKTKLKQNNSIVKYSIVKDSKGTGNTSPESPQEIKFFEWIRNNYPHIAKMEQPLTIDQYTTLRDQWGEDAVTATLSSMENWRPLIKKNRSAYRTALKWLTLKK